MDAQVRDQRAEHGPVLERSRDPQLRRQHLGDQSSDLAPQLRKWGHSPFLPTAQGNGDIHRFCRPRQPQKWSMAEMGTFIVSTATTASALNLRLHPWSCDDGLREIPAGQWKR